MSDKPKLDESTIQRFKTLAGLKTSSDTSTKKELMSEQNARQQQLFPQGLTEPELSVVPMPPLPDRPYPSTSIHDMTEPLPVTDEELAADEALLNAPVAGAFDLDRPSEVPGGSTNIGAASHQVQAGQGYWHIAKALGLPTNSRTYRTLRQKVQASSPGGASPMLHTSHVFARDPATGEVSVRRDQGVAENPFAKQRVAALQDMPRPPAMTAADFLPVEPAPVPATTDEWRYSVPRELASRALQQMHHRPDSVHPRDIEVVRTLAAEGNQMARMALKRYEDPVTDDMLKQIGINENQEKIVDKIADVLLKYLSDK